MNSYAITDDSGAISQLYRTTSRFVPCDENVSDTTHYVDTTTWQTEPKKAVGATVKVSGLSATISGVPAGMLIEVNGAADTTDGAPLRIEFDLPGTYAIQLSGAIEYLDTELEVTVEDAEGEPV